MKKLKLKTEEFEPIKTGNHLKFKIEEQAKLVKISKMLDNNHKINVTVDSDDQVLNFETEEGATFALLLFGDELEPLESAGQNVFV